MSNPSLIWSQLSIPNPPVGAIPFVDIDNASIVTDTLNFFYTPTNWNTTFGTNQKVNQLTITNSIRVAYTDTTAIAGAAIINKPTGRFKIAAGQSTVVITNNLVSATSIVDCGIQGAFDTTATRIQASPANGSITFTLNANATGDVIVWFNVINTF